MSLQLAAFLRTTLPLDLGQLAQMDSGSYHSIWLPDHLVSFWPDSIWTPEFTDLATVSPSPHRHLDALAVAATAAGLTCRTPIATSVVDTARRHPAMLAQSAITISHLSQGRFILGLGAGERENCLPYGVAADRLVSRFEEAIRVIRLLWNRQGPVDFAGQFYSLHHARLDAEPYDGRPPPVWIGASGPRMLDLAGRHADGWWPAGMYSAEEYHAQWTAVRQAAERAGRDPDVITPAFMLACLIGEPDEIAEMIRQPLLKAFALQMTGESFRKRGFSHPMGDGWRGIQDIEPHKLTRKILLAFIEAIDANAILSMVPHGTPGEVALQIEAYHDAGVRVASILDYGGMAGLRFAASSAARLRQTEDEVLRRLSPTRVA